MGRPFASGGGIVADRAPDRGRRGDAVLTGVPSVWKFSRTGTISRASSVAIGKPDGCLPRDRGREHVAALELVVAYLVSSSF